MSWRERHVGFNFRLTRPRTVLAVYNAFGLLTLIATFELFSGIIYEVLERQDRKYIKFITRGLRMCANHGLYKFITLARSVCVCVCFAATCDSNACDLLRAMFFARVHNI